MEWIRVAPGAPYFTTESGEPWTPIGQNDGISWIDLGGLFRRRNVAPVESYLQMLARHGVSCLRLMLEYCHTEHRYIEQPAGVMKPAMVTLWDDLFQLCERHGLRILLTPYDTFWMWRRWKRHPYNIANGGPCATPANLLTCPRTREAMKTRFDFAIRRWSSSGVLFAWDLWNEIHPAHAGDSAQGFHAFISDMSSFVRETETRLYGRSHPQTVSVFGPHVALDPARITEVVFRHPSLDFVTTHCYEQGTIDNPKNTVDPAISVGKLVRAALAEIQDNRPFFDSEHGPIEVYKDFHKSLPEAFDDEYFRHIQWAHFASGGAGGGMRWPNRKPHSLTRGMRLAQRGLAGFVDRMRWECFARKNWNAEIETDPRVAAFGCGDGERAVIWLLRRDTIGPDGLLDKSAPFVCPKVTAPALAAGTYSVTGWDTYSGAPVCTFEHPHGGGRLAFTAPGFRTDIALAVVRKAPELH